MIAPMVAAARPRAALLLSLGVLTGCARSTPPPAAASAKGTAASRAPGADACAVWNRENEFARSVSSHDTATFAEHVLPGAVFVDGGALQLGRDAIVKAWGKTIAGEGLVLTWHPSRVVVTGDPNVALSRGPYWIELTKPDQKPRYLAGTFQSVWIKDTDGVWRVAIDGGTADPAPATEDDITKLKNSIETQCPAGGA